MKDLSQEIIWFVISSNFGSGHLPKATGEEVHEYDNNREEPKYFEEIGPDADGQ